MIEQSWLELITLILDSSALLITILLLALVNIGLKWLPSVNRMSFFLGLFLYIKAIVFLEHFSSSPIVETLYTITVPLILLLGPLMTDFTYSTLRMEKGPALTNQARYLLTAGYLLIIPSLSLRLSDQEQASALIFNLAQWGEIIFALMFVVSSSYYFINMLWRLFRGSLYSIGYGESTYGWLKSVWLTMSFIWITLLYGMFAGVSDINSQIMSTIISGLDLVVLFALAVSTAVYCKKPLQQESQRCKESIKYQKTALTQEQANDILNKLDVLMAETKPYLNSAISVDKLAALLNTQPQYLSQAINQYKKRNFYELIAEYRVTHAKDLLINYPQKNILDTALESGFNAKSSFNNTFKKLTGITPTQFRKLR